MTEIEAIKMMKYRMNTAIEIAGKGENGKAFEDMEMAISALEKQERIKLLIKATKDWSKESSFELIKAIKEIIESD